MKNKGFTLIELLAVIAIIAMVAMITTPIVINLIQSSRENAFKDTAHSLVVAAGTYQAEKQALNEDTTLYINYNYHHIYLLTLVKFHYFLYNFSNYFYLIL